jgi:hypothetical protein
MTKDLSLHEAEHEARCDLIDALSWLEVWVCGASPTEAERIVVSEFVARLHAKYPHEKQRRAAEPNAFLFGVERCHLCKDQLRTGLDALVGDMDGDRPVLVHARCAQNRRGDA